jgi:hypothetical protein
MKHLRNIRILVVFVIVLAIVGIASMNALWALSSQSTEIDQPSAVTVLQGQVAAELNDIERQDAWDIALNDPAIKEILDGRTFTKGDVGVWTTKGRKIGAGVHLILNEPKVIERDWRGVSFESESGDKLLPNQDYRELTFHQRIQVKELYVRVDLEGDRVVAVSPVD